MDHFYPKMDILGWQKYTVRLNMAIKPILQENYVILYLSVVNNVLFFNSNY